MLIKQGKINKCGIYGIKTNQGKILYVGGAKECNDAYSRHRTNLINGAYCETNKDELQTIFNTEQDDLIFYVIEECKENELDKEETKYIELYSKTIINSDMKGKRRKNKSTPEETKHRRQANEGENNPHNTKLSEEDVFDILDMLKNGVNRDIIENKYDICKGYTYRIGCDRWVKTYNKWKIKKKHLLQ